MLSKTFELLGLSIDNNWLGHGKDVLFGQCLFGSMSLKDQPSDKAR